MTGVSAHDVARELRRRLPALDSAQLQKLLYNAQGWHLIWADEPLFSERIEAWIYGPVVAEIWADEKHDRGRPDRADLPPRSLQTIDYVVKRYGQMSGPQLIRQAHREDPWREVSENGDQPAMWGQNPEITHDALRRWFSKDKDSRAHQSEVARNRQRRDIYSLGPPLRTPFVEAAVARALAGERVRDTQPE